MENQNRINTAPKTDKITEAGIRLGIDIHNAIKNALLEGVPEEKVNSIIKTVLKLDTKILEENPHK